MENFNIESITIFIGILTNAFLLFGQFVSIISIFHSKHRIKELDEQIEIAKKNNLPINKNLTEMLESLLFQSSFGFWINHWKIKFYTDYYNQNKLTPIMLKLLNKRNYLLIDSTNKILITQITKTHKLMYYFYLIVAILLCLIFIGSISYSIFTPAKPNNFLALIFVSTGFLSLISSGIILTRYISPYNWAIDIRKRETK